MPKIIASKKVSEKQKIDKFESENARLLAEVERLQKVNTAQGKKLYGGVKNGKSAERQLELSSDTTTYSIPSYLRPTAASTNRQVRPLEGKDGFEVEPSRDADQSHMYKDGKLVRIGATRQVPSYMESTQASRHKMPYAAVQWGGFSLLPKEGTTLWETNPRIEVEPEPSESPSSVEVTCSLCEKLETGVECLAHCTHLEDDWGQTPEAQMRIPYKFQSQLLTEALNLGQDILFFGTINHWPELQQEHWIESPREVKLERNELMAVFGEPPVHRGCDGKWKTCDFPSSQVREAIFSMVGLRNVVAHQVQVEPQCVDNLLYRPHNLAVVLGDEKRALKAQGLRDRLRAYANKAHEEVSSGFSARFDPLLCHKEWALHHQRTFEDVVRSYKDLGAGWWSNNYHLYSSVVKYAAWDWNSTHGSMKDSQVFRQRIEEAKSFVQISAKADRCDSIVGDSASLLDEPVEEPPVHYNLPQQDDDHTWDHMDDPVVPGGLNHKDAKNPVTAAENFW